ncbi:MAG: DODA-type extradiol aromatic ring-opening family dioxygenase [Pseudomonadota bacterium]
MARAPVLFVSHGSPMFAVEPGRLGPLLQGIGPRFAAARAVLVVSPHWQSPGVEVMTSAAPATVHDFGGFPDELHRLAYDAPGAPEAAQQVLAHLRSAGVDARADAARGRDHGVWVPMRYLLPAAATPVFQMSLPLGLDAAGAHALGRLLAPLRETGIAVVGSGSLTHNLHEFRRRPADAGYAQAFADWVRRAVLARDDAALVHYLARAPHAQRAHPTDEHYLPLLVAAGAARGDDVPTHLDGGMTYGVLSMDSYLWDAAAANTPR